MKPLVVLAAMLSFPTVALAANVTIIDPSVYSAGTDISNAFPSVRLRTAQGTSQVFGVDVTEPLHLISDVVAPIYVSVTDDRFAHAAGDVWSANSLCCGDQKNVLKITFAGRIVSSVAVLFEADDTDTVVLQLYDSNDVLLRETYRRFSGPRSVSLTAPSGKRVAYALATFADTGRIATVSYVWRSQ